MRTGNNECKHCGVEYEVQYSGENVLDIPREYQSQEYCPECKKAIVDALATIPKKFAYKSVPTDEVDLDTLLRWEEERNEEIKQSGGLFAMTVLVGSMNLKTGAREIVREVIGREDKKNRIYIYAYWSDDKSRQRIMVERRINLQTGEPGKYKMKK